MKHKIRAGIIGVAEPHSIGPVGHGGDKGVARMPVHARNRNAEVPIDRHLIAGAHVSISRPGPDLEGFAALSDGVGVLFANIQEHRGGSHGCGGPQMR